MALVVKGLCNFRPDPGIVEFETPSGGWFDLHNEHEFVSVSFNASTSGTTVEIWCRPIRKTGYDIVTLCFSGVDIDSIELDEDFVPENAMTFWNLQYWEMEDGAHFLVETGLMDVTFRCSEVEFKVL